MLIRKNEKVVGEVNANGDGTWTATAIQWGTSDLRHLGSFDLNGSIQAVKKFKWTAGA